MKVISYSRLGNPVGNHPVSTDISNAWCGQAYAENSWKERGLDGPTVFLYPIGVDPKVTIIPDPFIQKSEGIFQEGTKKTQLLHYKLPQMVLGNDSSRLTRVAHRDGFDANWSIILGEMPGLPVPKSTYFHYTEAFSWEQKEEDQDNYTCVTRVYNASLTWRDDLWWLPTNPVVSYNVVCRFTKYNKITNRLSMSQPFEYSGKDGPVPRGAFDPSFYVLKAKVAFGEAVNSGTYIPEWSLQGNLDHFLQADQNEVPPLLDLFNERHRFYETCWTNQYSMDWLVQHAFFDACQDVKKMNDNMIQNIVEIAKFIFSLAKGGILKQIGLEAGDTFDDLVSSTVEAYLGGNDTHGRQVLSNWGSSWLTYRYAYSTTKMDLEDFSKYLCQKTDLYFKFLNKMYHQRSYGYASRAVDGVRVECRCQMKWRPRVVDGLHTALKYIHEFGLEINPYVLWDMVPFSFIFDWFGHVGDVANVISEQKYLSTQYFDFEPLCFSVKYDMTGHGSVGTRYFRWYQGAPVLEGYMWFDDGDDHDSAKTVIKRTLDTGSLTINMLGGK